MILCIVAMKLELNYHVTVPVVSIHIFISAATSTPRLVLQSSDGSSLLDPQSLTALCDWEHDMVRRYLPGDGCDGPSLPLYVSALRNKTCGEITADDVSSVEELLSDCSQLYFSGDLQEHCDPVSCETVPKECYLYDAVFKILHYIVDVGFVADGDPSKNEVTSSMLYLREEWYDDDLDIVTQWFLEHLDGKDLRGDQISCPAMDLRISQQVFNAYVLGDLPWYALAMGLVVAVLLIYLQSLVLTVTLVINVIFTISVSYFCYFFLFRLAFFPFMNLLAGLLLIAVGADDMFILNDIWQQHQRGHPEAGCEELLTKTLQHGALSIFVTSLTTSAALFANLVSDITAIRCFGVFAGICIIVNFLLMVSWVPAVMVLVEKATRCCVRDTGSCHRVRRCAAEMARASTHFWGVLVPKLVLKVKYLWVALFLSVGIGGFVAVFAYPKLSLPSSDDIQLFSKGHPFEVYKSFRDDFRFEIAAQQAASGVLGFQMLWGVEGVDNGNLFNPDDLGYLVFTKFDPYCREAQLWLLDFCQSLQSQWFYHQSVGGTGAICYMSMFQTLMEGPCNVVNARTGEPINLAPCCTDKFPVSPTKMKSCLIKYAAVTNGYHDDLATSVSNFSHVTGEFLYDSNVRIHRYVFKSNISWTPRYDVMDKYYTAMADFMTSALDAAPEGLQDGWFTGERGHEYGFYDLQKSLASGTFLGISLSLAVGFLVVLLTTLNILLTLYAIFTISLVIVTSVAILVLLQWELNAIESLIITLSVGLSIDFTIHYGVAYTLSKADDRSKRISETLASVGSAVTMAAVTTFMSGAAIMPGRVLSYQQFGIFLMVIMAVSWTYATLFFLPLCAVIGPLGHTGDLKMLCKKGCDRNRCQSQAKVSGIPTDVPKLEQEGIPCDKR